MTSVVTIVTASLADADDVARLRTALWPTSDADEVGPLLRGSDRHVLVARREGAAVGFAEVALRQDYVNGCDTSPVGFLEGIYVVPDARRQGVARLLVEAAQQWARSVGCSEFASDTGLDNALSQAMHMALGFTETQRVVFYRKRLGPTG